MATVNKTFRLHEDVVRILDELVADGGSRSRTVLIEELIRREARRRDRDRRLCERAREYAEAWADPEYRAEQLRIAEEFWPLDVEAWLKADPEPYPDDSAGR
ncbi:MAG TPA: ribbon-helix-helix protein, CopG family [Chloroflexota bacterium]|jgi:predicted nucleic acid-binding protein|nr:ribbon-helix-helix protein, CopG family [Chloroflexota bacterium]